MADAPVSAFISYSRTDSAFIDRLEADLRAYGFDTWVDRQHLEGGADWARKIEQQIARCEALVVALSPDAITSTWVRREITFALNAGKHIIPIIARPVASTPIEIVNLQYIDLSADYTSGLQDLRVALLKARTLPPPPRPAQAPQPLLTLPDVSDPLKGLVEIPAPPPAPNPDLMPIFMQAQAALAHDNLDLAEALLSQIAEQEPDFGNGLAAEELQRVRKQLEPLRIERLHKLADEAHARGAWGQEIGALRALLELPELKNSVPAWSAPQPANRRDIPSQPSQPSYQSLVDDQSLPPWLRSNSSALGKPSQTDWSAGTVPALHSVPPIKRSVDIGYLRLRLARAEECQKWAWLCDNARAFAESGDTAAVRVALQQLWDKAPFYGDPAHISPASVTSSPTSGAFVTVMSGHGVGRVIILDKDTTTIGRHRESDIFLEDLAVSRLHTTINKTKSGEYVVRDENSANGTYVNEQRVTEQILQNGDTIQIGQTVLLFRLEQDDDGGRRIFRIFSN